MTGMAPWWEEAFRGEYLRVYPHRDDASAAREVAAWVGLLPGLGPGRRVLDLACGAGRHLRALAGAGAAATGTDLSPDLLAEARRQGSHRLVRCDNRRLPFRGGIFHAVTCFFTSFGYFEAEAGDAAVLAEAARVLAPGGGLLLDLMDPASVRRDLVPESAREEHGLRIVERRGISADGRRVEKRVTLRGPEGERSWTESVRLYDPGEVEGMAAGAGLRPRGRFGGHDGTPWVGGRSPRCVLVLQREAA